MAAHTVPHEGSPLGKLSAGVRLRRGLLVLLRCTLAAYAVVVALLYFSQEWLLFPGSATRGKPEAVVDPPAGSELLHLRTRSGTPVVALFGPALPPHTHQPLDHPGTRPTLVYFYGNGTWLATALDQFQDFRRLGANVMAVEYAGYGLSGGEPGEHAFYETADAAYDALMARRDTDPHRIVAVGSSLGGAVAIDLASRRPVAGLAVFSSFTSMTDMAARQYPWVPVALLLRHRFESERKIRQVRCPLLIAHGTADELVPPQMADRLARAAAGPVTQLPIEGAGHNDVFLLGGDRLLHVFARFLDHLPATVPQQVRQ